MLHVWLYNHKNTIRVTESRETADLSAGQGEDE